MRLLGLRSVAVALAALVLGGILRAPAPALAADAPVLDYLYVGANEGVATGGHSGLRLGDHVFHFERQTGGLLRIKRESFETVRHRYAALANRTITLARVPVSPETHRLVLDEFTLRYVVQDQHFRAHEALRADRRLLEAALGARLGRPEKEPMMLEGVGFFFDEAPVGGSLVVPAALGMPAAAGTGGAVGGPLPALTALRGRVAAAHGAGFLDDEVERLRRALAALGPGPDEPTRKQLALDRAPLPTYAFSQRYRDLVTTLSALEALRAARPLREGSRAGDGTAGPILEGDERALVERLTNGLAASLVRLVRSSRPDRGFALLLGMARLVTLAESLEAGRWVFLDGLPAETTVIRHARLARYPDLGRALLAEARGDFDEAVRRLSARSAEADRFPEADWAALEAAGGHLVEVTGAVERGRDLRVTEVLPLPARAASHARPALAALDTVALRHQLALARAREASHGAELERVYRYEVFTRNCVTEIFEVIDASFARVVRDRARGPAELEALVRAESTARLGGHVETAPNFFPAAAAVSVERGWAVAEIVEIPSYRRERLARMYREENPLRVFLRESNTFTSTLYRRPTEDSAFLFFTDDTVVPRPLFGALNLVTGIGAVAAGLVMLPVDGGDTLVAGIKGIFFSLPELAFLNIRKGSFEYVERRPPETEDVRRAAGGGASTP